jgi:hypothetical protein
MKAKMNVREQATNLEIWNGSKNSQKRSKMIEQATFRNQVLPGHCLI